MSQYQDYFFSDDERQEEYSMLKSPLMYHEGIAQLDYFRSNYFDKELPPTYEINDPTEIDPPIQSSQEKQDPAPLRKQKRIKRFIDVDDEKKIKRREVFKGLKDDTTQLNANFKTILFKRMKEFSKLRQLDSQEKALVQQFGKGVPSFLQLKKLCKSVKIRQKGLTFIKSSKFLSQIINGNSTIQNKMTMLKYSEALKRNFQSQKITKWKDIQFD